MSFFICVIYDNHELTLSPYFRGTREECEELDSLIIDSRSRGADGGSFVVDSTEDAIYKSFQRYVMPKYREIYGLVCDKLGEPNVEEQSPRFVSWLRDLRRLSFFTAHATLNEREFEDFYAHATWFEDSFEYLETRIENLPVEDYMSLTEMIDNDGQVRNDEDREYILSFKRRMSRGTWLFCSAVYEEGNLCISPYYKGTKENCMRLEQLSGKYLCNSLDLAGSSTEMLVWKAIELLVLPKIDQSGVFGTILDELGQPDFADFANYLREFRTKIVEALKFDHLRKNGCKFITDALNYVLHNRLEKTPKRHYDEIDLSAPEYQSLSEEQKDEIRKILNL